MRRHHGLGRTSCAWLGLAGMAITLSACELTEVTAADAEDVLVVESVLRAGEARQVVLLHRAVQGAATRGEAGARVAIRPAEGPEVLFEEAPLLQCITQAADGLGAELDLEATCYASPVGGLPVQPGGTYELLVETRGGERLRGRTTVPGDFAFRVPTIPDRGICTLPPQTNLPVEWRRADGAWSYLSIMQITGLAPLLREQGISIVEPFELTGLSVSERDTTIVLPAQYGLFDRFTADQRVLRLLQGGFPAGVRVSVTMAATDRNYVNAVRGGSFNPSGNVRISSVVGDGVGVFGSLVIRRFTIDVRDPGPGAFRSCAAG